MAHYDKASATQDEQLLPIPLDPLAPSDPTLRNELEKDKTQKKQRVAAISLDPKL
jgi:hypothetical protein